MHYLEKLFNLSVRHGFEPALDWVIDHPAISVIAVVGLVYWAVRGYRMI